LSDEKGKQFFLKTQRIIRADVGDHFKNPDLNDTGFSTFADISGFEAGKYLLGLAARQSDTISICTQFKIHVTITK
jgi:hypothetical protein